MKSVHEYKKFILLLKIYNYEKYQNIHVLCLFIICQTSPLGLWIKNIVRKKEIVGTNFDEENEQELLDNYSENMNRNFKNAEYNISYNSN